MPNTDKLKEPLITKYARPNRLRSHHKTPSRIWMSCGNSMEKYGFQKDADELMLKILTEGHFVGAGNRRKEANRSTVREKFE